MNITIIAVGKIKENYLREGIAEFQKRLRPYANINIIEVPDEKTPDNASDADNAIILAKEGQGILRYIENGTYVIVLDIQGKMLSSEELAHFLAERALNGQSKIAIIIGGSLGLSPEVKKRADYKLSFSRLTFPHQMMRLILFEQIYRAFRINQGAPYHK